MGFGDVLTGIGAGAGALGQQLSYEREQRKAEELRRWLEEQEGLRAQQGRDFQVSMYQRQRDDQLADRQHDEEAAAAEATSRDLRTNVADTEKRLHAGARELEIEDYINSLPPDEARQAQEGLLGLKIDRPKPAADKLEAIDTVENGRHVRKYVKPTEGASYPAYDKPTGASAADDVKEDPALPMAARNLITRMASSQSGDPAKDEGRLRNELATLAIQHRRLDVNKALAMYKALVGEAKPDAGPTAHPFFEGDTSFAPRGRDFGRDVTLPREPGRGGSVLDQVAPQPRPSPTPTAAPAGGPQVDQVVTVDGKQIKITKIYADGTFDGVEIKR